MLCTAGKGLTNNPYSAKEKVMGAHVYWLFFFVLLYWAYCITIGVSGYLKAKSGTDYFIAGRQLNIWVFVSGGHSNLLQRLDICRASGPDLEGWACPTDMRRFMF